VTTTGTIKTALIRGAMTNILNPKVALFVLAFLPNFTNPNLGPIALQILILGIVFAATGFVITSAYGLLAGVMRKAIQSNQNFINKLSASVYAILALRLATQ
jgi:threonine/homoserine/homoserine lactone efflux protein